jgi:outer membrane protein assembly factor BamE
VAVEREAARARDLGLALLDVGVVELLDPAALQAQQVVVVAALVQLEYRFAGLEMLTGEETGLLELGEDAVDGGEADVDAFGKQRLVDVFGREVAHLAALEELEDLAPGQGGLEPAVLQALHRAHPCHYMRMRRRLSAIPLGMLVGACGYVPTIPGVTPYKIDIQQGNYISQEMVTGLKPGMSKEEVRLALGTPLLTDIFHADRWDYLYWREKPGAKREQRKLTVFFEDGRLTRIDGDVVAAGATQ